MQRARSVSRDPEPREHAYRSSDNDIIVSPMSPYGCHPAFRSMQSYRLGSLPGGAEHMGNDGEKVLEVEWFRDEGDGLSTV